MGCGKLEIDPENPSGSPILNFFNFGYLKIISDFEFRISNLLS